MTVLGTVSDNSNWNELYLQAMDFLGGASTNLCRILQEKRRSTRNSVKCQEWRKGPFPLVLSQSTFTTSSKQEGVGEKYANAKRQPN